VIGTRTFWHGCFQSEKGPVFLWDDGEVRLYEKKVVAPRIKQEVAPIAEVVAAVLDKTGNGVKDWYSPGFLKSLKDKT
jgi:hypothetical protein